MKYYFIIFIIILFPFMVNAQQSNIDSLKNVFKTTASGPQKYKASRDVYEYYEETNRDSALYYANQELLIAGRHDQKIAVAYSLSNKAYQLLESGKFGDALQCLLKAFAIAEDKRNEKKDDWDLSVAGFKGNKRLLSLSYAHHMFALLMGRTENIKQQIVHFKEAAKIGGEINRMIRVMLAYMNLGQCYLQINKADSALYYEKESERLAFQIDFQKYLGIIEVNMGDIYQSLGNQLLALQYYYRGIQFSTEQHNLSSLSRNYLRLSNYHLIAGNEDSALYYSTKNLHTIQSLGSIVGTESNVGIGYEYLYLSYKLNHQFDSAFKYQGLALVTKDSLNKLRIKNLAEFQNLTFNEQLRLQKLEKEKVIYQNNLRVYFLMAGIGVLLLLAIIFYRNNRQKQKANKVLETTLTNLKSTQAQLIQSEKMASLGELTAGIAHEIQNPLNFVNNFSEVNKELIAEMKGEIEKENYDEVKALAKDVEENEEKINHHGKRADAIVKGMLQHSRSSSGVKEPTDINALADEYLRLAYHGLRAKDKSFNATTQTDFDKTIGNINIIPQDIGRVILNLITNAFYAVTDKKKQAGDNYEPIVTVKTSRTLPLGGRSAGVLISVSDNANGIPQKVLDKIFQPFFTTKPTGQGTGLGLSLSYDIVKAHGGEINVKTEENEGSEFIIKLPV